MCNEQQNLPQLVMYREELSNLMELGCEEGVKIEHFREGYGSHWEKIISASFNYKSDFKREIESSRSFKPERVYFVFCGGVPAATATAWYNNQWKESVGYLHMVGMLPEYAGRGFGLKASLAALYQMAREGKTGAVLNTDDFRIPAIKTYLKLGFMPQLTHESHRERWVKILEGTGRQDLVSELKEEF